RVVLRTLPLRDLLSFPTRRSSDLPSIPRRNELVQIDVRGDTPVGYVILIALAECALQTAEAIGLAAPTRADVAQVRKANVCVGHRRPAVRFIITRDP